MHSILQKPVVSDEYRSPTFDALKLQIPIAILCLLMLDFGQLAKLCGVAIAAHWTGILIAMSRRPQAPTVTDIAFVRHGFLWIFLLVVPVLRSVIQSLGFCILALGLFVFRRLERPVLKEL